MRLGFGWAAAWALSLVTGLGATTGASAQGRGCDALADFCRTVVPRACLDSLAAGGVAAPTSDKKLCAYAVSLYRRCLAKTVACAKGPNRASESSRAGGQTTKASRRRLIRLRKGQTAYVGGGSVIVSVGIRGSRPWVSLNGSLYEARPGRRLDLKRLKDTSASLTNVQRCVVDIVSIDRRMSILLSITLGIDCQ